ncbi:unnamed protein product [Oppiella nova]|uniref:Uncharacterized protein n=1 Tax=Oppiella nova TaxID=334625 RepID=A0A7R9LE25_9ACAR|nr:unnamed protein product [Oppiella nova]CAG2162723.1 unnamed protein product [Oppiella nova]
MNFEYIYRYIWPFTRLRLRSFRELALIIATFMCISLYLTTYLFDSSPPLLNRSFFNDGLPTAFQQPVRNILSQFNNNFMNSQLKYSPSFAASGYQSAVDQRLHKLLREI